jgi:ADP-heptose:LPS heptosyltransferase
MDQHAVAHNLAPLAAVGITTDDRATVVVPSANERDQAEAIVDSVADGAPFWLMHPGAGKLENLWPTASFAAVATRIVGDGRRLLVLQGPADGEVVRDFREALAAEGSAAAADIHYVPPVSVGVCAGLLERADRFLCNDTGLMHVAGAVGVPTVALFGPTEPELWAPLREDLVALRAPGGDLASLSVDRVWEALGGLPGRSGRKD